VNVLRVDRVSPFGLDDNVLRGIRFLGSRVRVAALALALRTVGAVLALALRAVRREQLALALSGALTLSLSCLPLLTLTLTLSGLALALSLLRHSAAETPDPGDAENGGDDVRRRAPLQAMQHIAPFPFLGM
jgi:hypothetical protein